MIFGNKVTPLHVILAIVFLSIIFYAFIIAKVDILPWLLQYPPPH